MVQTIREVMTDRPVALAATATLREAARQMKNADIGDVLVLDDTGHPCGVLTDRDIVVRAIAEGRDPSAVTLDEVCSHELVAVGPDDPVDAAVDLMRTRAVRRLPVIEAGNAVGMVSIGDLAKARDPGSALADISGAQPNR